MPNYSIGLSALQTSQYALDVISNNMANANTPGFHRQNVQLESSQTNYFRNQQIGSGVQINYIERIRNQVTESSLTNAISDVSAVDQMLLLERQVEAMFHPGEGSLNQKLDSFFGELTKLSSTPGEPTQRAAVVEQANQMASIFHNISTQLFELKSSVRYQIEQEVDSLNDQLESLSVLTGQIQIISISSDPNRELDQRDELINKIAEVIDVSRQERFVGGLSISFGGSSIQQGKTPTQLKTIPLDGGAIGVSIDNSNKPVNFNAGRLPALMTMYNTTIPEFEAKLDELAAGLIQQFDQIHATGVGIDGSFSLLDANRAVEDASVPLSQSGAAFPIGSGDLSISILDPAGNRSTVSISIDPETQSLDDLAAAISTAPNLQAAVNPQTNRLQIIATPGYTFDFTGSLETIPALDNFSGSSSPTFSGSYLGDTNQTLSYTIAGTGDVGISNNLFANVYNEEGALITRLNIGNGYEAGTELEVFEGVSLAFSPGTVNDGDTFESPLVNNPDETGILSSLGLNSFFLGTDANSIEVNKKILDDPRRFASGKSGDAGDTSNLFDMIEKQQERSMGGNRLSFSEFLNEISTNAGSRVQSNAQLSTNLNSLKTGYEQERDSISGVDLNEELVYLQQFQKSYEAAVRVIQTAESMLDELFSIVR